MIAGNGAATCNLQVWTKMTRLPGLWLWLELFIALVSLLGELVYRAVDAVDEIHGHTDDPASAYNYGFAAGTRGAMGFDGKDQGSSTSLRTSNWPAPAAQVALLRRCRCRYEVWKEIRSGAW
ncbi:hypothetical protein FN846DRAFT_714002 [Sphaerosporella brunnea]|uniref:Uncharacterized protein n=1 Tax=Sphaerosporella brunnea TaxID=1250544 RepID=A0A5J5EYA6_9PEZI|nr:hypothetical protein FN846DRAFT_714002 [Sphaerosporella brunnea]